MSDFKPTTHDTVTNTQNCPVVKTSDNISLHSALVYHHHRAQWPAERTAVTDETLRHAFYMTVLAETMVIS